MQQHGYYQREANCRRPTRSRLVLLATNALLLILHCTTVEGQVEGQGWRVRKLHAPSIVDPRDDRVVLHCDYDLEGMELDSVTWWKYNKQIYRYMPSLPIKGQSFPNESDVNVSLERSNGTHLVLRGHRNTTKNFVTYEGTYFCEVLTKNPILTGYASANITTAIVPQDNPVLEGVVPYYQVGEHLDVTCTSAPSLPAAELTFYVNNKKVENRGVRKKKVQTINDHLISTILTLSMRLNRNDFRAGSLSVSCRAALPGVRVERDFRSDRSATLAANNQRLEASYYNSASSLGVFSLAHALALSTLVAKLLSC